MTATPSDLEPFEEHWLREHAEWAADARARHDACPPLRLIAATLEDAVPDEVRSAVLEHLTWCGPCGELAADLRSDLPDVALTTEDEDALLRRITSEASMQPRRGVSWRWWGLLVPIGIAAGAVFALRPAQPTPAARAERPAASAAAPAPSTDHAAPSPFALSFSKPPVRLSLQAMTWRGAKDPQAFAKDLRPALDAFRADRFGEAAALLVPLTARHPEHVEPWFYLGVSRLFTGDATGAIDALTRATAVGDEVFAADANWYLAVAIQRAGRDSDARARLDGMCRGNTPRAGEACKALHDWDAATSTAR